MKINRSDIARLRCGMAETKTENKSGGNRKPNEQESDEKEEEEEEPKEK